jgi:hypothetical protein
VHCHDKPPETSLRDSNRYKAVGFVLTTALFTSHAHAAEGFKPRFPLSGTLGGEIVAPLDRPGWYGSAVVTQIEIDKVTDDSGEARKQLVSGSFATPPIAGSVRTASYAGTVDVDARQSQTQWNFMVGYLSEETFAGGRFTALFNLPYTTRLNRRLTLSGETPTLSALSPAVPAPVQAATQAAFGTAYQANLAAQSAAGTRVLEGFGDAEISGGWAYQQDKLKVLASTTLALPTGQYDANSTVNIGFGNFYTLRPSIAAAYSLNDSVTLGARTSLGFNTRNKDNEVRSGNFAVLDLAAVFRTPIGVLGPHVIHAQQYQDDSGGIYGPNRFRATGVGAFFTTLISPISAALNLSFMQMVDSRNAMSGSFIQARLSKAF